MKEIRSPPLNMDLISDAETAFGHIKDSDLYAREEMGYFTDANFIWSLFIFGNFRTCFFVFLAATGFTFGRAAGRRAGDFLFTLTAAAFFFFVPEVFFEAFFTGRLPASLFRNTVLRLPLADFFFKDLGFKSLRGLFKEARLLLRFCFRAFCVFWRCLIKELSK